jgi:sortase A
MDWRWWVGNLGKALIATGLLMFGFVAYQLWGTGIETARAQNQLENEFDAQLAEAPPVVAPEDGTSTDPVAPPSTAVIADPADAVEPTPDDSPLQPTEPLATLPPVPIEQQNIPELENGDALARLEIPRIGRNDIVVAGVQTSDLKRGPGHFPDTPLPGQLGNAAIAGHRTTYGSPFFNVDKLEVGDEIIATTLNGRYTYRVTGQQIVASNEYWVVATDDPTRATLTLTSCHPKYTAQKRIVVFSELVASESAPVGEPVINYGRPEEPADNNADVAVELPNESDAGTSADGTEDQLADETVDDVTAADESTTLSVDEVSDEIVDAFSDGWFSDPGANGQVALWGLVLALVSIGAYLVSRKLRRDWAGALIGIMPFVVTLYFFFQNVNRLLPPNL